ncbi:MAG: VOC family protein [SAR324 cluster bacterium]|nr:VOC family protein [SAR324 cluster bacterium]MCZ6557392.1 VOC family protein [SAR324 cluster bacterium]
MAGENSPDFSSIAEELPGFLFIDHIAIAVPQGALDEQVAAYAKLGFQEIHRETIGGNDQVREALLQIGGSPNLIQLIEPLSGASPVQKAIDRNGGKGGLNHVGFRVRDIQAAFDDLQGKGFQILDAAPRPGSRGTTVFFMHPKGPPESPFNVLIEVVQE